MSVTITLHMLRRAGVCETNLENFQAIFGESTEVTTLKCGLLAQIFDFGAAAPLLLSSKAMEQYRESRSEFLAEYNRVVTEDWATRVSRRDRAVDHYRHSSTPSLSVLVNQLIDIGHNYAHEEHSALVDRRIFTAHAFAKAALAHGFQFDVQGGTAV